MFNVSKKTLSLVLCLTLIASVVVFCFAGSASAVTTVKYPTYDSVTSLAAKPEVKLTFDGEEPYGIPLGRYTNDVTYDTANGYAKVGFSSGYIFFGKDGTVGNPTVSHGSSAAAQAAYENCYKFTTGTTYTVSFSYKFLAGAQVKTGKQGTINMGIAANPNTGSTGNKNGMNVITESGTTPVWTVDGVAQETGTVLTVDSDWQTFTRTFTATADGCVGIQCFYGNGAPNPMEYFAIDNFVIFDNSKINSAVQNDIAFDDGGVVINRYVNSVGYATEENGNGYCVIDGTGYGSTGSFYFANAEYGKTILNKDQAAADSSINDKMFKFLPGHSYEVTFRFRIAENANNTVTLGSTKLQPRLAKAPAGDAHNNDDLYGATPWAKDIIFSGITVQAIGVWQDAKITFTVKTAEESEAGFTGAYFGFRGAGLATHIDDYNVRELINYRISSFNSQNVSLDFEGTAPSYSASAGTVEFLQDENDNTYMKYTGGGRLSFNETRVLKADKKYYISFDAKTDDGCTHFNFVMGNPGSDSAGYRIFFNNDGITTGLKEALTNSGSKFYIDGQDVSSYDNFKPSDTWQHFGFTLNLDSAAWKGVNSSGNTFNDTTWKDLEAGGGVYFLFGADGKSVCYDNIKITQFDEIASAVPTTGGQVYRDTYTYSNDFDSITTSDLIQNTADTAKVEAETDRGNIVKLSSGASRFTLKGSDVLEKGYKYTVSFDGKLDPTAAAESERLWLMMASETSTDPNRRFILRAAGDNGCSNPEVLAKAFKLYINGNEVLDRTEMDITKEWRTFTIEIDYTNEDLIKSATNLSDAARYFYFGCANGWFDNLKIVKKEAVEYKDTTQVSIRQASGSGDSYVSAGLRFKNSLPNDVVAAADEIGFVVIPSSMATQAVDSWYKLDGTGSANAKTVVCKKPGYNWIYEKTITDTYYQLVLTGLSTESGATAYNRRFSAVMYTKTGDAYTYYALGETSFNHVGAIQDLFNAQ